MVGRISRWIMVGPADPDVRDARKVKEILR
jgi:hypothetical protein